MGKLQKGSGSKEKRQQEEWLYSEIRKIME